MEAMKDRLKTLRELVGKDQKDMADALKISFRSWQDYELGKSVPGGKVFEALAFLGYNVNWVLTGEGSMKTMGLVKPLYKQVLDGDIAITTENMEYIRPECDKKPGLVTEPDITEDGFVKVPRYRVDASAGHGTIISSEQIVDHLAFRADWVRHALGVPVASLALINVTGDSMEPTLSNGDLILIDRSITGVDDSGVYVLQFDGKLKVKRIHSKSDGSVDLISDNSRYPTESLVGELAQGLKVVGRVVWCGRRM